MRLKSCQVKNEKKECTVISVIMQRPNFYRKYATPIFDSIFFAYSELGDAWLKASLVLQHILYHHPKKLTLPAQKNGRAVQLIFSHIVSSTFTTKS